MTNHPAQGKRIKSLSLALDTTLASDTRAVSSNHHMPGVICCRTPSQDCVLLGHLYCSSYDKEARFAGCDARTFQGASSSISQPTGCYTSCRLCSLARPRPTLLSVSPEIVLLILAELPGSEILKCRYVCKTLKRIIDQSIKLQYNIQSNARGLEPLGDFGSASSDLAGLLFRERSWTMFGSIPSTFHSLHNPPDSANGLTSKRYYAYHSGKLVLCCGNHIVEHTLYPSVGGDPLEYEVPDLEVDNLDSVAATHDVLVYSTGKTLHVYSKVTNDVVGVLRAPHLGTLGTLSARGNWIAALFRSERRCSGVLIWNWKRGKLIDTLHDVHSPAISVAFFDDSTLAVVHTDRSACSARVDTYGLGVQEATLKSSVSLPDAHPSKWYAKADIYTGDESAPPGSEQMMQDEGIVAIDVEMRVRAPHNPITITADRRLAAILVAHKRVFIPTRTASPGTPVARIPWTSWPANHFRILTGVCLSPQRPVWGYRLVAVGPEPDKVSLFDFCPVGAREVAQVWKGNGTWGVSSSGRGGVSVRAALAQRARTLVRVNTLGAVTGWFDNLKLSVDQIPYVVSVRRGVPDVLDTMLDGGNIVVTLRDRSLAEPPKSIRTILFNFVP
ncbi:unnamed protein product [Rhizoctonia solani]|uniref:F-box domain-containing protein n=1 Tax=Rhizoctonia solani TaxID=456999 RepID=A0A8H3DC06_9AGAM|nr:unnamed protein product [Rhizoctonia solani]